jgi:hypothetical protein
MRGRPVDQDLRRTVGRVPLCLDPLGEQQISYRALKLNVPFSLERAATVGVRTVVWFGLPTFWVEFSVMPAHDAFFAATI